MIHKNTRLEIIEQGARIMHKKGFNNTGIKEILDAANVPKGSFYHYFKNKEDFGLNILDHYAQFFVTKAETLMNETGEPPLKRLKKLFDEFLDFFEHNDCELGCPIGNLSQEMADLNPSFRIKLDKIFQMMRHPVKKMLDQTVQRGELSDFLDTHETAEFIINSWEGALLKMKVQKRSDALRLFEKMIFENFLKQ